MLGAVVASIGVAAVAQSFGPGTLFEGEVRFGPPSESANVDADPTPKQTPYFGHDQDLKLALLLAFMLGGGILALLGRPRLRRVALAAAVVVLGFVMGGFLCPTAAVQNVFLKWDTAYLLLFLVPVLGALVMGRLFCGYVCPFGALQELLHVSRWALRIPRRVARALGWVRFPILLYLVARVLATHEVILDGLSPFKPLFTWGGPPATLAFTALLAALSVVVFRPFCRVLCPYGALLSLVSRARLLVLRKKGDCRGCHVCTRSCPAGVMDCGSVDDGECLVCGACASKCPPGCLGLTFRWRKNTAPPHAGTGG
ncbi:MAG: 4Fe-4S binding protein [Candidatus Bipolaricaulota bacterium]